MKNKKVVLGMSGGVDSSVAALLLKEQGYDVTGVFLRNYPDTEPYLDSVCPFKKDKEIAEKICKKLDIPFQKIDYRETYLKQVIEPMFEEYKKNKTPNPDTKCNTIIKFPALWNFAKSINADFIATGHYAKIKKDKKGFHLLQGRDNKKDQSYFLYELTEKDISHTIFPLGDLTKEEVRKIAKKEKLPNHDKQSSRGICFIGKLDFKDFLKKAINKKEGIIKSPENKIIGTHPGYFYFTNGERAIPSKGINIDPKYINSIGNKKLYIAKKIASSNTLIIATEESPLLKTTKVRIKKFHLINKKHFPKTGLKARVRHLGKLIPGNLTKNKSSYNFKFAKPQKEIANGQVIALYKNKTLIGGGIMSKETQ